MFEFKFYLDMTCVGTAEVENQLFDEADGDYPEHHMRPATGYLVWNKPEYFQAALDYINSFCPLFVPWRVSIDPQEGICSWLRYEQMGRAPRMQEIEALVYEYDPRDDTEHLYVDMPADDLSDESGYFWAMHFDRDGDLPDDFMETDQPAKVLNNDPRPLRMANMCWGEDMKRDDGCMLFTDIMDAVKQKRAAQLHAMLLATKRPHNEPWPNGKQATPLGRTTNNWLYTSDVFSVVADFM